jgi:aminopeptidase N
MVRSRSLRAFAGAVAGAIALAIIGAGPAQAESKCTPGAPGVGDEYFPGYGNGGYDVKRYDLDIAYDPATDVLEGRALVIARATQKLCSFNLDFVGLEIRAIRVGGRPASWDRSGQELTVDPRKDLKEGHKFRAKVRYDGVPVEFAIPGLDLRTGWMATPEGVTVAGQPQVASGWFPVNDHPRDKASYSFEVSVPTGYEVAANGFLRDVDRGGGTTTFDWKAREPMASYLATVDVADWDVHRWRTDDRLPVYDAVSTQITGALRAEIDAGLAKQGEVLDLLSEAFGPYPFSTIGAIVPNQDDLFFALENQTRPVYSKLFWLDSEGNPENADFVVVHELAHQWFGDDVALHRWQDIWLNEGFATYAEWLWEEHEGRATPQEIFQATYDEIPADDPFWATVIGDPGVELLFDGAVYVRGAMTLQALRNEIGDRKFWRIVRRWAASRSGGTGTTPQFIRLAERIADQQLDDLFDLWLFTGEKPPPEAVSGRGAAARLNAREEAAASAWRAGFEQRIATGAY